VTDLQRFAEAAGDGVVQVTPGLLFLEALDGRGLARFAWTDLGRPVIDRGLHAIVPLAVAPVQDCGDGATSSLLLDQERQLERDCVHLYGGDFFHAESVLDLDRGIGRQIARAVIGTRAPRYWWHLGRHAVVIVRTIDPTLRWETLALHVLPLDWVHDAPIASGTRREASRARRIEREQETVGGVADVTWSWPLPVAD